MRCFTFCLYKLLINQLISLLKFLIMEFKEKWLLKMLNIHYPIWD